MTTVVLISAVCASLAGGVLFAYAICFSMFYVFRIHSLQVAQQRAESKAEQAIAGAKLIAG